jgi:DNA-binding MarR family transcriptional regulator
MRPARGHEPSARRNRHSMTDRSATSRRVRASPAPHRNSGSLPARADADAVAQYAGRGPECAFANIRLLARVVTHFYDEALKPVDLRASQLALMWAIVACEPVELGKLGDITHTDQTTLSRTVDKLRQAGLVAVDTGDDRRVRLLRLTTKGRRQFARAMPFWDAAQRDVSRRLSLAGLQDLARQARRLARDQYP